MNEYEFTIRRGDGAEPIPILYADELPSTNDRLLELCRVGHIQPFTTLYAGYQTRGKGQRGNHWEGERGKNLLFSIALYPSALPASSSFILSEIMSLSVIDVLDKWLTDVSIKWPNDIYWADRKLGGMLIENEWEQGTVSLSVAGVGLNVNQSIFRSDAPNPVSMCQIAHREFDLPTLLQHIVVQVANWFAQWETRGRTYVHDAYVRRLYRLHTYAPYRDRKGEFVARIDDVKPDGNLLLTDLEGRVREYAFKEIQFIRPDGGTNDRLMI